jgi:hypothetical protein
MTGYGGRRKPVVNISDRGLCTVGKKCVRKDHHAGACWPADKDASDDG